MCMKNPPHPGKVLRIAFLEPLGLGVAEGARVLGVSKRALLSLVKGDSSMSVDMAIRLAKAFSGPTTETWLRLQSNYDIAQVRERKKEIKIKRYQLPLL